jgi:hypothetical protein
MRTRMKKLALLLSLLTLGALGLVACGGGDDDEDSPAAAQVPPDTTAEARFPAETTTEACKRLSRVDPQKHEALLRRCSRKLSPEQVQELERGKQARDLRRAANDWASRFAVARCKGHEIKLFGGEDGYVNCKRVSAAFQKSFADATVEDIKFKGVAVIRPSIGPLYRATVKFSNGEVVAFVGPDLVGECAGAGSGCPWYIAEPDQNRRFLQAAAPLE